MRGHEQAPEPTSQLTMRQLGSKLKEHGLTLSPKEKKHWLTLTPRTILKKLKTLKDAVGSQTAPISPTEDHDPIQQQPETKYPLLSTIDGLTSHQTYKVIALYAEGMVSARKFSSGNIKVKFHPTIKHFGLDKHDLQASSFVQRDGPANVLSHQIYERVMMDADGLSDLIHQLVKKPLTLVAGGSNINRVLNGEQPLPEKEVPKKSKKKSPMPYGAHIHTGRQHHAS